MLDEPGFSAAATRARVAARALELGRSVDLWSLTLAALALAGWYCAAPLRLALPAQACLLVSLLAAGVQKAYALRVGFDARLFADWAERWNRAARDGAALDETDPAASGIRADLLAFDRALAAMGVAPPRGMALRDLESRLRGACTLLARQLMAFATQFAAGIAALLATHLPF